jgi:hypothetical protein
MALGFRTLKAERQDKAGTLGIAGSAGAFTVSKIPDDHVPSRTNRERRSFKGRILQVQVHHFLDSCRSLTLEVKMDIDRQRLAVGPLPCATLTGSHSRLNGRYLWRAEHGTDLRRHRAFSMTRGCHEDSAKDDERPKFPIACSYEHAVTSIHISVTEDEPWDGIVVP